MTYLLYQKLGEKIIQTMVDPLISTQRLINELQESIFSCLFLVYFPPESISYN